MEHPQSSRTIYADNEENVAGDLGDAFAGLMQLRCRRVRRTPIRDRGGCNDEVGADRAAQRNVVELLRRGHAGDVHTRRRLE